MREIDFLPEWYKERKRRQLRLRRQYVILGATFLAMMGYNLTCMRRIARAGAELNRFESWQVEARQAVAEFDRVTRHLNRARVKADLIGRIDSKIDVAAMLAEMSHIIGETVVLRGAEFVAEPLHDDDRQRATGTGVRVADDKKDDAGKTRWGAVRFRILLTGVAASPNDVAALVCRLDDSPYFRRVYPSYSRPGNVQLSAGTTQGAPAVRVGTVPAAPPDGLDVTEFEIVCYLANYREPMTDE